MNQAQQLVHNWISNAHKYDDSFRPPSITVPTETTQLNLTDNGNGLYIGDFPPADINSVWTVPNTYQPTITTTHTGLGGMTLGWPYTGTYQPITKTLAEVLGDKAAEFTILPSAIIVGCGKEKHCLADLLLKLDNVPFIELGAEIAVAPAVYNAIIVYTKMGEEYAGMALVDFLNQILAQK